MTPENLVELQSHLRNNPEIKKVFFNNNFEWLFHKRPAFQLEMKAEDVLSVSADELKDAPTEEVPVIITDAVTGAEGEKLPDAGTGAEGEKLPDAGTVAQVAAVIPDVVTAAPAVAVDPKSHVATEKSDAKKVSNKP